MNRYLRHYKALASLGIPIIIGQVGTIVLGVADTVMIGHHSTEELAGAAFVNSIFVLGLLVCLGFSNAITPMVSNLFGQGNESRIGEVLRNAIAANMLMGLFVTGVLFLTYCFIDRLGQPQNLIPVMRPYFAINMISIPFACCFNVMKQLFDGITHTRVPMWTMIGGVAINIIGNYLLIYGMCGFPEMGLTGAGIATLISRMLMMVALACVFFLGKRYGEVRKGLFAGKMNKSDFRRLWSMGIPLAAQLGMETAAFSLSGVMVGWIGMVSLAAHQVMLTISQFFYLIYFGMAAAISVRVGYFSGQGDHVAMKDNVVAGFRLIMLIAFCLSVPTVVFGRDLIGLFTDNEEVGLLASSCIAPLIAYQFGDGLQYTYSNALRGIGRVKPLMTVAFVAYFMVSLPAGYMLGIRMGMGLAGIWWAFPLGLTGAGVAFRHLFNSTLSSSQH